MRISGLIKRLEEIKKEHGDLRILVSVAGNIRELNPTYDLNIVQEVDNSNSRRTKRVVYHPSYASLGMVPQDEKKLKI